MSHKMGNNSDPFAVPHNHSDTNLFFRRLPPSVDDAELRRLFESFGPIISAAVMRDIHTGESLGTAFVRFEQHDAALAVMKQFVNVLLDGCSRGLIIQWAKRQHDDAIMGNAREHIRKLFVRNIPLGVTEAMVHDVMAKYGAVEQVTLHSDTAPPPSRSYGRSNTGGSGPAAAPRQHAERVIAFITFGEDHVAAKACDAIHNTCPFECCDNIPLMTKLAEDNRQRSARRGSNPRYSNHFGNNSGSRGSHHNQYRGGNSSSTNNSHHCSHQRGPDSSYNDSFSSGNFGHSGSESPMSASRASSRGFSTHNNNSNNDSTETHMNQQQHVSPKQFSSPRNGPSSPFMLAPPYAVSANPVSSLTTQVPELSQFSGVSKASNNEVHDMEFEMVMNGSSTEAPRCNHAPLDFAMHYTNGGMLAGSPNSFASVGTTELAPPIPIGVSNHCPVVSAHMLANTHHLHVPMTRSGNVSAASSVASHPSSVCMSKGSMGSSRGGASTTSSRYRHNPYNPVNPHEIIM